MHNVSKPPKTVCMMQTELTKRAVAQIGEAIPHELANQMVLDYKTSNPNSVASYTIGREIIEKILGQKGCAGLRFFNAYNEAGEKTLVYAGVDCENKTIASYSIVDNQGAISTVPAIVADRIRTETSNTDDSFGLDDLFAFFF